MSYRETGKKALATALANPKNITVIEKHIHDRSEQMMKDEGDDDDTLEDVYKRNIYQVTGDILSGNKLKPLLSSIKEGKLGWNHSTFNDVIFRIKEQDDFIVNPFEVEEGVLECRCGSRRVFSYSKQCKSNDEPTSTIAQCMACKARWTDNH